MAHHGPYILCTVLQQIKPLIKPLSTTQSKNSTYTYYNIMYHNAFIFQNTDIKTHRRPDSCFVWVLIGSLTVMKEHESQVFQNKVIQKIYRGGKNDIMGNFDSYVIINFMSCTVQFTQ